jgi:hypothetical protein
MANTTREWPPRSPEKRRERAKKLGLAAIEFPLKKKRRCRDFTTLLNFATLLQVFFCESGQWDLTKFHQHGIFPPRFSIFISQIHYLSISGSAI